MLIQNETIASNDAYATRPNGPLAGFFSPCNKRRKKWNKMATCLNEDTINRAFDGMLMVEGGEFRSYQLGIPRQSKLCRDIFESTNDTTPDYQVLGI